jgi:hypothetical protein
VTGWPRYYNKSGKILDFTDEPLSLVDMITYRE